MTFPFRAPVKSMAPPVSETPYQRARQEWDARMGAAVLSARSWRMMALGALALCGLLAASLTFVAMQKRTFVHVVEVAPEGQVLEVRAAHGAWRPSETQIAYHVGRFVRLVRSLPTDPIVLRENWLEAYSLLGPKAAAHLSALAREDDPFAQVGRVGRTVQVRSILARSDRTWEVRWVERSTSAVGSGDGDVYTGLFEVATRKPRTAGEVADNPLGLVIVDFSWSAER
jgi:type IV secretion system protein VirB5